METEDRILINVIGVGYDVCVGDVSPEQKVILNAAVIQEKQSLHNLLFDEDFYKKYELPKVNSSLNCRSWKDFSNIGKYRGAHLLETGQIEIWINGKRVRTYKFNELANELSLFPAFIVEEKQSTVTENTFYIGLQEKGHLAKFRFKTRKFIPNELKLHIIHFPTSKSKLQILYTLSYLGVILESLNSDTVIIGTIFKTT
jgi:hypothetical protein